MGIKHHSPSAKPEGADPTKVSRNKWNELHDVDPGTFLQGSPEYGLGIDGALALDGVATVLGMVPAAGVYTMARDIHATSVTFTGGAKLKLASWRLFCQGAITGQGHATTIISNDGNSAVGKTAGAATAAGYYAATFAGGIGQSGTVTGSVPAPSGNVVAPPIYAASGTAGGAGSAGVAQNGASGTKYGEGGGGGGACSAGSGFSGGNSGTVAPVGPSNGYGPAELASGRASNTTTQYQLGQGGGSGGGQLTAGSVGDCGGGGASGGKAFVAAQSITGVTISARGGNGGNASTVASTGGGWGGGGGGPGGEVIVTYSTCSDLVCDVTGGSAGNGAAIGAGCLAGNGGAGFKGRVWFYNLAGDGTVPTIVP